MFATWHTTVATMCSSDPDKPANGNSNLSVENNSTVPIGAVIMYTCFLGFKLVGDVECVCQPNGEWNGTVPICQPLCHGSYCISLMTMYFNMLKGFC